MKKITIEYLNKIKACKEGIDFFKNGNLDKIDWDNFDINKNVVIDYKNYFGWLKEELDKKRIYDENNNEIYCEDISGYWIKRKYDKNNNEIYYEDSSGYWIKREYDKNNNEIYCEDIDKHIITREFIYNASNILVKIIRNDKTVFELDI